MLSIDDIETPSLSSSLRWDRDSSLRWERNFHEYHRWKLRAVSGTRSRVTRCILERKTLKPRRTSGYLRFVEGPLTSGSFDFPITVPKRGARAPQLSPTGPASAKVTDGLICRNGGGRKALGDTLVPVRCKREKSWTR